MNIQALMKQAKNLQNDMMNTQKEIEGMTFVSEGDVVNVTMNGKKKILSVTISENFDFSSDNKEILEDMLLVSVNEVISKIDKLTEDKMGKFGNCMPGLF